MSASAAACDMGVDRGSHGRGYVTPKLQIPVYTVYYWPKFYAGVNVESRVGHTSGSVILDPSILYL